MSGALPGSSLIVIKLGGSAQDQQRAMLSDIAALQALGHTVVVVHGGGPAVTATMERLGLPKRFHNGLRVTDAAALEVVQMVLGGVTNQNLVALAADLGLPAVGLNGLDGALLAVRQYDEEGDLGFVGAITTVRPAILTSIIESGFLPIIAPLGLGWEIGPTGARQSQVYNLNADTVAGTLAAALGARCVVFLTDVAGVRDAAGDVIARLNASGVKELIANGVINGGMIPKVRACLNAVQPDPAIIRQDGQTRTTLEGVQHAVILDGRQQGSLLAWARGQDCGTTVVADA